MLLMVTTLRTKPNYWTFSVTVNQPCWQMTAKWLQYDVRDEENTIIIIIMYYW